MATQTGVITVNGIKVIECDVNPSLVGLSAPIGSIASAKDGSGLFYKFDSGDTQWYIYSGYSATVKTLTGDVTSIIDTETVMTDSTFALEVNSRYYVSGQMRIGCSGTGGVKLGTKYPALTTCSIVFFGRSSSNTAFIHSGYGASGFLSAAFNNVSSATGTVFFGGLVTTGATSGNLELIFASITAGQTSTIYSDGFYMEIKKLN